MNGPDDKTKLMQTPSSADADRADDRTRAMPKDSTGSDKRTLAKPETGSAADDRTRAMPAAGGDDRTGALPVEASDAGDRTRALPVGETTPRTSPEDRTRILATPSGDDATAVIGVPADDSTVALETSAGGTSEAMDDDVTIVRPQAQRRPRLLVRSPEGRVEEHAFDTDEVTIGRASSCTLVLASPEVSRSHARIVAGPAGSVLHVVGARHNTLVNGELVEGERALRHGDVIDLASERLVFAETADTPPFDAEGAAAPPARSYTVAAVAAAAAVVVGIAAYLLGSGKQPQTPPAAPAVPVAAPLPAVDVERQAAEATAAAREAAAEAVRAVAERAAAAHAAAARKEHIGKLLYEGDIALLENRLTTPTNGSAFYAYSEVLTLDPENVQARTKIAAIIDTYLGWAESARARGNRSRARLYADKAAYIHAQTPSAGDSIEIDRRISALGGTVR